MQVWEIFLLGLALSMDACTVAMTNGMTNPKISTKKALLIGLFFGFFQFLMPVIGYFITGLVTGAFMSAFKSVSAWISFLLLAFLGGRMLVEGIREILEEKRKKESPCPCMPEAENVQTTGAGMRSPSDLEKNELTIAQLFTQAIATSIDALAVGVALQAAAVSEVGLALGVWGATGVIGMLTFVLSVGAVYIGKFLGSKLADKAAIFGGIVLVSIGLKILIESFL